MSVQSQPTDPRDRKASSLTEAPSVGHTGKATSGTGEASLDRTERRGKRRGTPLWVDFLLLVLIVAIAIGGFLGYRAIRDAYAPDWEERDIIFLVEMTDVDPALIPASEKLAGAALYDSLRADALPLGTVDSATVTDTPLYADTGDAGSVTVVELWVKATARYREDKGYYVGDAAILSGTDATFRVGGMTAEGAVIAIYLPAELESVAKPAESGS